ncbi:MAG: trypsin-like peptidase domain-containing protein [Nocardioides sp.]|nr:trypsin-like peptidase domain-containing protein [Nocardioides sp.]
MSDERSTDRPANDEHGHDEPTQPLAGWPASGESTPEPEPEAAHPEGRAYGAAQPHAQPQSPAYDPTGPYAGQYGQPAQFGPAQFGPGQFGPGQFGPGPQGQPGYGQFAYGQPPRRSRSFPVWVWPAVAALALVVGLVGGIGGAALQDELSSRSGTVNDGLEGVRTQEAAPLDADNGSVSAVAQALLPSTVQILAQVEGESGGATGSGFVLDREGHVVTNNHVVASAADEDGTIVVVDHEGERHDATVMGRSAVYDLAVLSVVDAEALEPAALGASLVLRVGDPVVAFGAPLGLSQTVTSGIVSALNRPVTTSGESDDESSYINAVQTDAAINPGNSGGPLVNLAGEVVGVNSAIATTGGAVGGESGNIGVGFAIPIEQVRTTVDQILRTGRAKYPVIGAQVRTGGEPDAEGATITEVLPDTPAEKAGLAKDDLIVAVDDLPVSDGIALIVAIRTHLPGDEVEMRVVRGGEESTVTVELGGQVG